MLDDNTRFPQYQKYDVQLSPPNQNYIINIGPTGATNNSFFLEKQTNSKNVEVDQDYIINIGPTESTNDSENVDQIIKHEKSLFSCCCCPEEEQLEDNCVGEEKNKESCNCYTNFSAVTYYAQLIAISIVILSSLVNLSFLNSDNDKLWGNLLYSCIGYLLPSPTLIKHDKHSKHSKDDKDSKNK